MGSKYTLSIELLLDGSGQSNKFWKKTKEKFRDLQQMDPTASLKRDLKVV